jgi:hypothetical protein
MKRIFSLIPALVILFFVSSCGDKDNNGTAQPTEKDKILVNYPWALKEVTDMSGKAIPSGQWDATAKLLPSMNFEFQSGNKVIARGVGDGQAVNGGTWYIIQEGKVLDINISGFKGEFGLQELTNSKMRLTRKMPVAGVEQETIMVFDPVIK